MFPYSTWERLNTALDALHKATLVEILTLTRCQHDARDEWPVETTPQEAAIL